MPSCRRGGIAGSGFVVRYGSERLPAPAWWSARALLASWSASPRGCPTNACSPAMVSARLLDADRARPASWARQGRRSPHCGEPTDSIRFKRELVGPAKPERQERSNDPAAGWPPKPSERGRGSQPARPQSRRAAGTPAAVRVLHRCREQGTVPCWAALHMIGEDRTEQLDLVPAQLGQGPVSSALRLPPCEGAVVQAPAPRAAIDGGMATETDRACGGQQVLIRYHSTVRRRCSNVKASRWTVRRSAPGGRACWWLKPLYEFSRAVGAGAVDGQGLRRRDHARCWIPAGEDQDRPALVLCRG